MNIKRKATFRVVYRLMGSNFMDDWRDYGLGNMTYMQACERSEQLASNFGASRFRYQFKPLHQKLIRKVAA